MCLISWMIRPPCEITDQLAVSTQNCFSTLFYTPYTNIKTSSQNAPKCTIARQKIEKFSREGHGPLPIPIPTGETQLPSAPSAPRFSRLRRSRSFSFTTRTLILTERISRKSQRISTSTDIMWSVGYFPPRTYFLRTFPRRTIPPPPRTSPWLLKCKSLHVRLMLTVPRYGVLTLNDRRSGNYLKSGTNPHS